MRGKKKKFPFGMMDEVPEQDDEPEVPPVWPDALEQILLTYRPAGDCNYTDTLTSDEIVNALVAHCGQAPRKDVLMPLLIEKGYRYQVKNGLELHWVLKKV